MFSSDNDIGLTEIINRYIEVLCFVKTMVDEAFGLVKTNLGIRSLAGNCSKIFPFAINISNHLLSGWDPHLGESYQNPFFIK